MGNVGSDYYDQDGQYEEPEESKFLSVKTVTSGKESLELFDYHCAEPVQKNFVVKSGK
jgi:hypothetical protein